MSLISHFCIISALLMSVQADIHSKKGLIVNFFANVKKVHDLVIISCDLDLVNVLHKEANLKSLSTQFIGLGDNDKVPEVLKATCKMGIYLDCTCDQCGSFLAQAAQWKFFNASYVWLIEGSPSLENATNIRIDSDVKVLVDQTDGYELIDIFSVANQLRTVSYANWTVKHGFTAVAPTDSSSRRNLQGSLLKTGVYLNNNDKGNLTLIEQALTETRSNFETLLQVKYFHAVNSLLSDILNFRTEVTEVTNRLGQVKAQDGLYSLLSTDKCDIVSSGAYISAVNDTHQLEFVYARFWLDHGLYYLLTSEFMRKSDLLTFFTPLAKDVWIVFIFFIILIAFMFKVFYIWVAKIMEKSEKEQDDPSVFINVFEIITNQGINDVPPQTSIRMIILSGLLLMLILFNLYSASLLTVILMPPIDPYRHASELIASEIQLSRYNEPYAEFALQVKMNESSQKYQDVMVENRSKHSRESNLRRTLVFNDGHQGVLALRDGLVAFGGESSPIEAAAASSLQLSEICNMKRQTLINIPMFSVLPKGSPYKELFKVVLLRAAEVGILDRILKVFKKDKGLCLVGVSLTSVTFSKVRSAFYILGGGTFASLILLVFEILWHKFHKHLFTLVKKVTNNEMLEAPKRTSSQQPILMDYYYMP